MPGHPRNWLCQAAGCAPLAQQRGVGGARSAETGGWNYLQEKLAAASMSPVPL